MGFKKLTNFDNIDSPIPSDLIPIVRSGVNKNINFDSIVEYIKNELDVDPVGNELKLVEITTIENEDCAFFIRKLYQGDYELDENGNYTYIDPNGQTGIAANTDTDGVDGREFTRIEYIEYMITTKKMSSSDKEIDFPDYLNIEETYCTCSKNTPKSSSSLGSYLNINDASSIKILPDRAILATGTFNLHVIARVSHDSGNLFCTLQFPAAVTSGIWGCYSCDLTGQINTGKCMFRLAGTAKEATYIAGYLVMNDSSHGTFAEDFQMGGSLTSYTKIKDIASKSGIKDDSNKRYYKLFGMTMGKNKKISKTWIKSFSATTRTKLNNHPYCLLFIATNKNKPIKLTSSDPTTTAANPSYIKIYRI